jgi:hypothetical protein
MEESETIPDSSSMYASSSTSLYLYYVKSEGKLYYKSNGTVQEYTARHYVIVNSEAEMDKSVSTYFLLIETVYAYYYWLNGAWHEAATE